MSLEQWLANGWVRKQEFGKSQISELMTKAIADLEQSRTKGLSDDWKFTIAYQAMLTAATAALASTGYRPDHENNHYRVIQSLQLTIGMDKETIDLLDDYRKKRNISNYERHGMISRENVSEIQKLAKEVIGKVKRWLGISN
jgi:hypothetical protein